MAFSIWMRSKDGSLRLNKDLILAMIVFIAMECCGAMHGIRIRIFDMASRYSAVELAWHLVGARRIELRSSG